MKKFSKNKSVYPQDPHCEWLCRNSRIPRVFYHQQYSFNGSIKLLFISSSILTFFFLFPWSSLHHSRTQSTSLLLFFNSNITVSFFTNKAHKYRTQTGFADIFFVSTTNTVPTFSTHTIIIYPDEAEYHHSWVRLFIKVWISDRRQSFHTTEIFSINSLFFILSRRIGDFVRISESFIMAKLKDYSRYNH